MTIPSPAFMRTGTDDEPSPLPVVLAADPIAPYLPKGGVTARMAEMHDGIGYYYGHILMEGELPDTLPCIRVDLLPPRSVWEQLEYVARSPSSYCDPHATLWRVYLNGDPVGLAVDKPSAVALAQAHAALIIARARAQAR